jgi:uncharacterized protein YbaR (Trm112 family)
LFIELAEVLVCPVCRSQHDEGMLQGLVAVVGELRDRKVIGGWLGCPACEARYPIQDGAVCFALAPPEARDRSGGGPSTTESPRGSSGPQAETALLVAALLSLQEVAGYVLLGQGLGTMAEELSRLAPASEIVALRGREEGPVSPPSAGVTHLSDTPEGSLPLRAASIAAAAILGAREDVIAEAARVLKPAGCLAVLGSSPAREEAVLSLLRSAGLDPIVVDPQAIVARRV